MESDPSNKSPKLWERVAAGTVTGTATFLVSLEVGPVVWEAKALMSAAVGAVIGYAIDK
jgi:hypothetical protein